MARLAQAQKVYLASGSPRRRELLSQIGVPFEVLPVSVPEQQAPGESPQAYVRRLALEKARAGLVALNGESGVVLGADTLGELDGKVLEKPLNQQDAARMLEAMSGREHRVLSAVAIADHTRELVNVVETRVLFRNLNSSEIERYWNSGEPQDKAGGYAIQGLGAVFVKSISGSYSAVVGLPLEATQALLAEFEIPVWQSIAADVQGGQS